jgi:uncharacterized protein
MKASIFALTFVCLMASLTGCTDQVPKCSDDDTINLVKNIVAEELGTGDEVAEIKAQFVIEYPRASGFNEAIKKYECEARLVSGGTYQLPITYESQIDDGGQHIVSVGGIGQGDLFQLAAAASTRIAQAKEEAAKARAAAVATAAPAAAEQVQSNPSTPTSNRSVASPAVVAPSVSNATTATQPVATPAQVERVPESRAEVAKPSFDCGRATTLVENTICGDATLSSMDALLAQSYTRMMAADIDDGARAAMKADQRAWLGRRNECSSKACLEATYRERIDQVCKTPVVSGVHPDCGSDGGNKQSDASPAIAPVAALTNDVPPAVRTFMGKSYGQFDAKHACWRTAYESQAYCMKVLRMDRIAADTGERFYLLVGGHPFDETGEPESAHVLSGLAGAFVFEMHGDQTDLVASNTAIYVGASGDVPEQWELVKLARTGYYGWKTTWGDCHQGYCGTRLTILAPYGKSVKDIAAFNIEYSDAGACDGQQCPDGVSSVESTVTIDTSATVGDLFPLRVAFKGRLNGKSLTGVAQRLAFDRTGWHYAVPEDWPLAGVDF